MTRSWVVNVFGDKKFEAAAIFATISDMFLLLSAVLSFLFVTQVAPVIITHEQAALLPPLPELPRRLPGYWHDHITKLRTGWQREGEIEALSRDAIMQRFDSSHTSIQGIYLFLPRVELQEYTPIPFFVVHGTWAHGTASSYDPADQTFQQLIAFAKELAYRQQRPVEIVSFGWSGENSPEARESAGTQLRILNENFYTQAHMYGPRWGYAHSHGGNVCNIASQDIYFETLIYAGTPVVEGIIKLCSPQNIGRLLSLYSTTDPWQFGGSYNQRTLKTLFNGNGREFAYQDNKHIYNIRVQCNGKSPGHVSLKWLMPHFWSLIDVIEERYRFHNNLDANVYISPDKIDYDLDPERLLQKIAGISGDQTPVVTIRKELSLRDVLPKMQSDEQAHEVASQLRAELDYSAEQEKRFALDFRGRSIHQRASLPDFFLANWREVSDLVMYYLPWLAMGGARGDSLISPVIDF